MMASRAKNCLEPWGGLYNDKAIFMLFTEFSCEQSKQWCWQAPSPELACCQGRAC